jgi:hypothetical protein
VEGIYGDASTEYGEYGGAIGVQYALTGGPAPASESEWLPYASPVDALGEAAASFKGAVWFRAFDEAGNVSAPAVLAASGASSGSLT